MTDGQRKLEKAITFAMEKHAGMLIKGSPAPFITHPFEVLSIAVTMTSDPEILAAAVLHDVVKDASVKTGEIEELFGVRVASLIAVDSEDNLESLKSASTEGKIIVLADNLSEMRLIFRDIQRNGNVVIWKKLNQKDKRLHEWHHRSVAEIVSEHFGSFAYMEYRWLIENVFGGDPEYCDDCPSLIKKTEHESHDLFVVAAYENGYCSRALRDEKPRWINQSFAHLKDLDIPNWCPRRLETLLGKNIYIDI